MSYRTYNKYKNDKMIPASKHNSGLKGLILLIQHFLRSTACYLLYNDRKCLQDIVSFYVEDFELGKTVLHSYQTTRESKTI